MEDDDDFTFPTTVAAPELEHDVGGGPALLPAARLLGDKQRPPLPDPAAPAGASRLWPFAAPLIGTAAAAGKEEEAPASRTEEDEQERDAVADDEERMDLLWDDAAAATTTASSRICGRAEPAPPERRAEAAEAADTGRVADAERMDLLWESFNEELLLRRAHSKADRRCGAMAPPGLDPDWYLFQYSPSDAESEATSASSPGRPRYGCAPTMLRASSRAGGAGQFCSSPRRRRRSRGAAAGWALLLRLFRRLFAVDKAAPRSHSNYVP